ncbi:RagB/SusD family nutrient uptake outer membrane protein [Parapedobacter tibetensis]|uniref:RagB/SusD family nutrient uptake outer membrane protein n=2 Tax=Parapedobacter tibetensis TaxID=2972951 RepID=UPI00214D651E|nr:RagB/SusD family nutrient uptake outer membrane protein [Parapedobacter tibetensis]
MNSVKIMRNKKIAGAIGVLALTLCCFSCKEFLTVEPVDRLTGNNFYRSIDDVESNVANMYSMFFDKINEGWIMGGIGEARSGEIIASPGANGYSARRVVEVLGENDLLYAMDPSAPWEWYHYERVTNWTRYYQVIQTANILVNKLEEGIPGVSDVDKQRYIAEATFMRCFAYWWMVRLYGDVVYYTTPYNAESLPREGMVSVLNKCIADLKPHKDNMPWAHADPALKGARASRGSIIALLMHMNMWNAGFDRNNREGYFREVASLGTELIQSNTYRLYPLTEEGWSTVMKGRSDESLFEFYRSINYQDNNAALSPFGDHFLRWPYKFPRFNNQISHCYYIDTYMARLYPSAVADKRADFWFEDMLSNSGQFIAVKFAFNVYASGNEDRNPDNTFLIFRYPDAILLHAEALAELARDNEAIASLNMIRERAEATPYGGGGGQELKDFIFWERCRELFGEGHRYFDLVRTQRIMNPTFARNPLNSDQYNRRAWTWPIDPSARNNNPRMVLNEYWLTR